MSWGGWLSWRGGGQLFLARIEMTRSAADGIRGRQQ
jgi:hypothetical protein